MNVCVPVLHEGLLLLYSTASVKRSIQKRGSSRTGAGELQKVGLQSVPFVFSLRSFTWVNTKCVVVSFVSERVLVSELPGRSAARGEGRRLQEDLLD